MADSYEPLKAIAYLVALREQNTEVFNECIHSISTLRRFHPHLPVFVYFDNLEEEHLSYLGAQPHVLTFPIGIDRSGKFRRHHYSQLHGWKFPELHVLAAKIDILLQTPGDTLFLDSDTEVTGSLDECLASTDAWMHADEGSFAEHDRDFRPMFESSDFEVFGWRGDIERLHMFNSGSIFVPERLKFSLYRAKEYLWQLAGIDPETRGDNRLDEQIALSIALQEATDYRVRSLVDAVDHYWLAKYEGAAPRYLQIF